MGWVATFRSPVFGRRSSRFRCPSAVNAGCRSLNHSWSFEARGFCYLRWLTGFRVGHLSAWSHTLFRSVKLWRSTGMFVAGSRSGEDWREFAFRLATASTSACRPCVFRLARRALRISRGLPFGAALPFLSSGSAPFRCASRRAFTGTPLAALSRMAAVFFLPDFTAECCLHSGPLVSGSAPGLLSLSSLATTLL